MIHRQRLKRLRQYAVRRKAALKKLGVNYFTSIYFWILNNFRAVYNIRILSKPKAEYHSGEIIYNTTKPFSW